MQKEFLDYYNENLAFMRRLGAEFAAEFPKIAARLDVNAIECQDPFIERLLEGTAFLSARVEQKLEKGYPRFLESMLGAVCPSALGPVPAFCNVKVSRSDLSKIGPQGFKVSFGSQFKRNINRFNAEVIFEPVFETVVTPVWISDAVFLKHDSKIAELTEKGLINALEVELVSEGDNDFSKLDLDYLDIYLNLSDQDASELCELLMNNLHGVFIKDKNDEFRKIDNLDLSLSFLSSGKNALSELSNESEGLNCFRMYLNSPDLCKFVRITGISKAFSSVSSDRCSLVFLFDKVTDFKIETTIQSDSLMLNVIPLLNLFKKRSNRHFYEQNYEVNVNVESTRPLDYEICGISNLEFFDENNQQLFYAFPFFSAHSYRNDGVVYRNFFSIHRRPRGQGISHSRRSPYNKQEVFVSVSGEDFRTNMDKELQFAAECLCTNADLPMFLGKNDTLQLNSVKEIKEVQIIGSVTRPQSPLISSGNSDDFKRFGLIISNFASIVSDNGEVGLFNLKQLVRSFSLKSPEDTSRMVSAIVNMAVKPKVYRFISDGAVFFENGYEIDITFSQKKLEGIGFYTFSRMIANLVSNYNNINVPLSIGVYSDERGYVYTCKTLKE